MNNKVIGNEKNIIFYNDEEGNTKIEVLLQDEDVWLNTEALAELFSIDRSGIVRHINNIYKDKYVEKFYLERPSLKRKDELIQYFDEFVQYNSDINGSGSLDKMLEGFTFEQALDRCLNMENEGFAKKMGRCPGKTFLLIRKTIIKL